MELRDYEKIRRRNLDCYYLRVSPHTAIRAASNCNRAARSRESDDGTLRRNARAKPSVKLLNAELLDVNHSPGRGAAFYVRHSLAITRAVATRTRREMS